MNWFHNIVVSIGALVASIFGGQSQVITNDIPSTASSSVEVVQQVSQNNNDIVSTTSVLDDSLKDYSFFGVIPNNLTKIKLSHHSIGIDSPWGIESNYKGNPDGSVGQYTFANGVKMTVALNKLSPQDELKQSGLSQSELTQYNSVFKFIASKAGSDFKGYDYENFLLGISQKTVDQAKTQEDKLGYSEALVLKKVTSFGSSDTVFRFTNQNSKGFIWMLPNSTIPSKIDFWGPNGWQYNFMFPAKQNISQKEVDALIQSIKII